LVDLFSIQQIISNYQTLYRNTHIVKHIHWDTKEPGVFLVAHLIATQRRASIWVSEREVFFKIFILKVFVKWMIPTIFDTMGIMATTQLMIPVWSYKPNITAFGLLVSNNFMWKRCYLWKVLHFHAPWPIYKTDRNRLNNVGRLPTNDHSCLQDWQSG